MLKLKSNVVSYHILDRTRGKIDSVERYGVVEILVCKVKETMALWNICKTIETRGTCGYSKLFQKSTAKLWQSTLCTTVCETLPSPRQVIE